MPSTRTTIPLLAISALTALPAASAHAAPHWSSPAKVLAPVAPATQVGAPQALVVPGGAVLGFGGDGAHPVAMSGTIAGGLVAKPITTGSAGTARGAVGADGTVAAVWTDNDHGHLVIAPGGGAFGAPVDLPGDGVNALAVAVSADGTTTVAWRTKTSPVVSYTALVAQVPKGGALGAAQTLDSGKSGISSFDVAAGPGGAVAVSYSRQATVTRTKVAVKPAGAAAFETPQTVSAGARSDIGSNVAFAADGTIVVAWANPEAGQVALRRPGAALFAAPASLGAPAFALDLEPTPQGGTALAFAAGGDVRAAVQSPTGEFAPVVVGRAPGNIPPQPAIAVDAAGTAMVAFGDATDGAVRAVVSGAVTTIGYGAPGTPTPVALAAGAAAQAVALWTDADGGTSAAVYGEDAPAGGGPGDKPPAADTRKPRVRLLTRSPITVTTRTTKLRLRFSCDEPCRIGISSNLRTQVRGRKRIAPIRYVDERKAPLRRAGAQTVTVTLGTLATTDLRRALRAGRGARVFLSVTAVDKAGNDATLRGTLTLRGR